MVPPILHLDGDPDDVTIDQDDVDYLIQSANFYLQHHSISKSDIVDTFAGLRPYNTQRNILLIVVEIFLWLGQKTIFFHLIWW